MEIPKMSSTPPTSQTPTSQTPASQTPASQTPATQPTIGKKDPLDVAVILALRGRTPGERKRRLRENRLGLATAPKRPDIEPKA
jgi:hypothetical protein